MDEYTEQKIRDLTVASEQGNAEAQYDLGHYYHNEYYSGKNHDNAKAAKLFRKAAEQGYANAQMWLGTLYLNGDGVPQNRSKAIEWMKKAAKQGQPGALEFMNALHSSGVIVKNKENGNNVLIKANDSRCFIASAVYGPIALETNILREWRDNRLLLCLPGRMLACFYYFVSPSMSKLIIKHDTLKKITRRLLDYFVTRILR